MSILSFGLVLAITAAQPLDPASWVMHADYPKDALRENRGGLVRFRLTASADGRPTRCEIISTSGHVDLDSLTCRLLMQRARFTPARDAFGKSIAATYQNRVSWWTEGMPMIPKPMQYDFDATVSHYPKGIAYPASATVALLIDPQGTIVECEPIMLQTPSTAGSGSAEEERRITETFGGTACTQAKAGYRPAPARNKDGEAIPSVQTAKIRLAIDAKAH